MFAHALSRDPIAEQRASIEDPRVSISDPNVLSLIFGETESESGESVSPDTALRVPAVWAAVNFLSGTIASLPLKVYRRDGDEREVDSANRWHRRLNNAPNPEWTSYRWRKYFMLRTLLQGRSYTFVDRASGTLWPLEKSKTKVKRENGRIVYEYTPDENSVRGKRTYSSDEVIDIPFILGEDPLDTISPVERLKDTIGLSLALQKYAARHFRNGGMPPAVLQGPKMSPGAANRASDDIKQAIANAVRQGRIPAVPEGYEIKTLGIDPEKSQMEASRRFQTEEVARVYDLPPVFLQDLTHGTYANTEQQDIHFVKHTLAHWTRYIEQELNLKLFRHGGRRADTSHFVEFSLEGLLRGDFKTRMDGLARGVQNSLLTPNEARRMDNRPPLEGGDALYLQQNMEQLEMIDDLGMPVQGAAPAGGDNQNGD